MALINLISGEPRNKVGGYVGAKWKGKTYFRAYTTPKNPKTEMQMRTRGNFGTLMTISSAINATILKPYTAKTFKNQTPSNRFMKINQPFIASDGADPSLIQIFKGGALPPTQGAGAVANAGAPCVITFTPATQLGTTDKYVGVGFAYNVTKGVCVAGVNDNLTGGQQSTISIAVPNDTNDEIIWGVSTYAEITANGIKSKLNSNSLAGKITVQ